MQITRESIFAICEELGEEKVKNRIPQWRSIKASFAREWLAELESKRESSRLLRKEQREAENLSISHKALSTSREALSISRRSNKIAISAMILSIITAIIAIVVQFIFSP